LDEAIPRLYAACGAKEVINSRKQEELDKVKANTEPILFNQDWADAY
jgi:hypothetical protein